jgi:hypothetical protein
VKKTTFWAPALALALTAFGTAVPAFSANIVQNGDFETGTFAGWTVNAASGDPWQVESTGSGYGIGSPFAGTYFASTGCVGATCITGTADEQASLSQVLTTVAGDVYTLTFEFSTFGNGAPNELDVLWNGTSVLDLGPGGTLGPISTYTLYTVTGLSAPTTSSTLTFLGRQDPSYDGLDNVDVELSGASSAPEPASFLLLGGGLPLLWAVRRRFRTR